MTARSGTWSAVPLLLVVGVAASCGESGDGSPRAQGGADAARSSGGSTGPDAGSGGTPSGGASGGGATGSADAGSGGSPGAGGGGGGRDAAPADAALDSTTRKDASTATDGAGALECTWPLPPGGRLADGGASDFMLDAPPAFVLERVHQYFPPDLPDLSTGVPTPHDVLSPSDLEFLPDGTGALVVLSTGLIGWLDCDFSVKGSFQVESANSLAKYTAGGSDFHDNEGVLGLTFDPGFATNHHFYVQLVADHLGGVDIVRLTWDPSDLAGMWGARTTIASFPKPQLATNPAYLANHDGGNPSFGPDGALYVAMGDGGIGGGYPWEQNPAQDLASPWGKLLRLDPTGSSAPEVVGYGLRNPFTHVWRGNEVFIGDVGSDETFSSEEIDRMAIAPGQSVSPPNYGWPWLFGPCPTAPPGNPPPDCSLYTDPVLDYRKDDSSYIVEDPSPTPAPAAPGTANRSAVILGPAYSGGAYGGYLDGVVVYADLLQGWLRGALFDGDGRKLADRHLAHPGRWVTGFAVGPDGMIYMLGGFMSDFSIWRLEVAPAP